MLYLAIDQHRKQLTVSVRDEAGNVVWRQQVSTKWKCVREFLEWIRAESRQHGGYVAVVEICGFNDWLLKELMAFECREVIVVQPEQRSRQKTDRRDANRLGELLWVNRERLLAGRRIQGLRRVQLPTARDAQDRQLTALRQRVGQCRTRTLNKVQRILLKHNWQQECPTKGLETQQARQWLAQLPLGEIDRLELDQLLAQWALWDQQLAALDQRITQRAQQHALTPLIATLPGAGNYSALALASRIGDIERFPRPESLANYFGLTPGCRNSGEATDRLGSITKQGSRQARFILGQMVLHVLRRDRSAREWFARIKRRRGAKIARVAVMRRLTALLWHMLKQRKAYHVGCWLPNTNRESAQTPEAAVCSAGGPRPGSRARGVARSRPSPAKQTAERAGLP
jgi:transposase